MPGKKSETNAWLVCSTTDEIASGTLEVHENKSDIMNVPKLTMRVKNNNRIEKTRVGNRFCLILEDAANHGKPLVVFSNSSSNIEVLHDFFHAVGAIGLRATDESSVRARKITCGRRKGPAYPGTDSGVHV